MKKIQMYEYNKNLWLEYELPLTDEEFDLLDHHLWSFDFDDLGKRWQGRLVITDKVLDIIDRLKCRVENSIKERIEELPLGIIKDWRCRKTVRFDLYNSNHIGKHSDPNHRFRSEYIWKRGLLISLDLYITFLTDNLDKNEDHYRRFGL